MNHNPSYIVVSLFVVVLSFLTFDLTAKTFYVDPIKGSMENNGSQLAPWSTLAEVIDAGMVSTQEYDHLPYDPQKSQLVPKNPDAPVQPGDTIMLRSGLHGAVEIDRAYNARPITILALSGEKPILSYIRFRSSMNWILKGVMVDQEPYGYPGAPHALVFVESHGYRGPSSHITVEGCHIQSGSDSWSWTKEMWNQQAINGIQGHANYLDFVDNVVNNVDMGITAAGDHCLVSGNQVINFSGDGMRTLGSFNILEDNLIKNCFNVDDNHDDGIQSFSINGIVNDSVIIRGNTIINHEDLSHPLAGTLQGIGCFDGPYTRWRVENNVVSVNHYHGITLMGAFDCTIVNNTVMDPIPSGKPGPSWIRITNHKDGTPSENCVVKNNIANKFTVDAEADHNLVLETIEEYQAHFVDFKKYDFRLKQGSSAIDSGEDAIAPDVDIMGTERPQGQHADIGAYEYTVATSTNKVQYDQGSLRVFPNPNKGRFTLKRSGQLELPEDFDIYSTEGFLVYSGRLRYTETNINLGEIPSGVYYISLSNRGQSTRFIVH